MGTPVKENQIGDFLQLVHRVIVDRRYVLTLHNVERDLSLTSLVVGTCKISLTCLSTSDTNSFRDEFNDEIIYIASFIPTCFLSTI